MRILVAVGETNRGGTETWLLQIARHLQDHCEFDFLVHTETEGAYDRQLEACGVRILRCTNPKNPFSYAKRFLSILKKSGPYDVVHSHVQCYSGWILVLAWMGGVVNRIAHSHSDLREASAQAGVFRKGYIGAMRALIRVFATQGLATSSAAAESLFGARWRSDPRWSIHLSCVDLAPFSNAPNVSEVRKSLGIPEHAIVVGHVGSFRPEKNHAFAVEIAAELGALSPRYWFVFKGDGALKVAVRDRARVLGIESRCIFLDADNDVARVLRGALDLFLFPSLREGLGLALLEAQAAGLRCFASDGLPREAIVVPELVTLLPLADGAPSWAFEIHRCASQDARVTQPVAMRRLYDSGYDMRANAASLLASYSRAA